jgi:branched-chain amino acid transport system ATP-binding protein
MPSEPLLAVRDLNVFRGQSHILQDVSLTLGHEPLAIVGRNGMGKTTLCEALMGLLPIHSGTITVSGNRAAGQRPFRIARAGIGYVPQGRRIFPSLSVQEHLRLVAGRQSSGWTIERIYDTFPRLAERRRNGGAELSGGEQQMLAIARALLLNPKVLVMDEPTEGLAPFIAEHLIRVFRELAHEGIGLLLVEQNLAVAAQVAKRILVMVNGQMALETSPAQLASNEELQRCYLGVGLAIHPPERLAGEDQVLPKTYAGSDAR